MLETVRCSSIFAEGSRQQGGPDASAGSAIDAAEPAAHAVDLMIQSSCIFLWNEEIERLDPFLLHLEEQAEMSRRCRAAELAVGESGADLSSDDSFEQKSSHLMRARASPAKESVDGSKTRASSEHLTADAASPAAARRGE
ncbi:hypothetical protein Emag_001322 [Eimeria magna]